MLINMDMPSRNNTAPPMLPPSMAVFLFLIRGRIEENTIIIIKELEPKYNREEVIKLPFPVSLTPSMLEKLKPSLTLRYMDVNNIPIINMGTNMVFIRDKPSNLNKNTINVNKTMVIIPKLKDKPNSSSKTAPLPESITL